jgi:Fe-S-cluster containining protein
METDEAIDLIPAHLVAVDGRGMRCDGERCSALSGKVGVGASCQIYEVRPDVCRACNPGDDECRIARAAFGIDGHGEHGPE